MKLYHRTTEQAALGILAHGFKNATGVYLTSKLYSGVWLSDVPLDANEGASGGTLLLVQLNLSMKTLSKYEWIEDGKPYREWLVPASLVNANAKVSIFK